MIGFALGVALIGVGYLLGFVMGVWATHDWMEQVRPGTSKEVIALDERQKKNQK